MCNCRNNAKSNKQWQQQPLTAAPAPSIFPLSLLAVPFFHYNATPAPLMDSVWVWVQGTRVRGSSFCSAVPIVCRRALIRDEPHSKRYTVHCCCCSCCCITHNCKCINWNIYFIFLKRPWWRELFWWNNYGFSLVFLNYLSKFLN